MKRCLLGKRLGWPNRFGALILFWAMAGPLFGQSPIRGDEIPANLASQLPYANFVKGKSIKAQKTLRMPQSPYLIIYVATGRTAEPEMWSGDPADGISARLFVYNVFGRVIEPQQTNEVNRQLGADKHYEPEFCGGLGSLAPADFKLEGNKITLAQFYAPGTARDNCQWELVVANGRVGAQKKGAGDSGLAAAVAKERAQLNQQAVKLYQSQQFNEAIYRWEELYGYWLNGPYARAGPYDEILNNLGFAYHRLKLYREAEKILLQCKQSYPARKIVYLNLADLYRDVRNKPLASAYYRRFIAFSPYGPQRSYAEGELKKLQ